MKTGRQRRAELRFAEIEKLACAKADGGAGSSTERSAKLAAELRRRDSLWRPRGDGLFFKTQAQRDAIRRQRRLAGCVIGTVFGAPQVVAVVVVLYLMAGNLGIVAAAIFTLPLLAFVLLATLFRLLRRDAPKRCAFALADRKCPDCGHDLVGTPNAVAPNVLDGYESGPSRCPECAAPWPLIPAVGIPVSRDGD